MPLRVAARLAACFILVLVAGACSRTQPASTLPRTADGKPNLQGVWQVRNNAAFGLEDHVARHSMPAGRSLVDGRTIPYLPDAAKQRIELASNPQNDPLSKCYMPGVPRIMYMPFPFHIYQTPDHIAITFEWSQVHRTIHTNGVPGPDGHRLLDGRLTRPLGRRHAGRRCEGSERQDLVRHHRHLPQRPDPRRRAVHDDGSRHDSVRGDDRGSEGLLEAVEDRDADLPAQGPRPHPRVSVPGGSSRKRTAISSAIRRRGIPGPRRSRSTFLRTGRR